MVAALATRAKTGQGSDGRLGVLFTLLLVLGARALGIAHPLGLLAHGARSGRRGGRAGGAVVARAVDGGGVGAQVAVLHRAVWVVLGVRADASERDLPAVATGPLVPAASLALDLPLGRGVQVFRRRHCRSWGAGRRGEGRNLASSHGERAMRLLHPDSTLDFGGADPRGTGVGRETLDGRVELEETRLQERRPLHVQRWGNRCSDRGIVEARRRYQRGRHGPSS